MTEKDILGSRANNKEDLEAVTRLVAEGKIKPLVSREFPLSDFGQALAEIEKSSFVGRSVIIP
jgi:D-arabinose 1-dehydrogenase-like Zn-dependent alcohol dehydrogenase